MRTCNLKYESTKNHVNKSFKNPLTNNGYFFEENTGEQLNETYRQIEDS
jgi:hypothetical protein